MYMHTKFESDISDGTSCAGQIDGRTDGRMENPFQYSPA